MLLDKNCKTFTDTPYAAQGVGCALCANNAFNGVEDGSKMCVV